MAQGIEKLTDLAEKWGNAAVEAIGRHGPEAVRLAETVARLDAIGVLAKAIAAFVSCAALLFFVNRTIRRHIAETKIKEGTSYDFLDNNPGVIIPSFAVALVAATVCCISLSEILNPMAWAGAFEPKIWIAAKILKL